MTAALVSITLRALLNRRRTLLLALVGLLLVAIVGLYLLSGPTDAEALRVTRELLGNPSPTAGPEPTAWALQHPELYTLLWSAVILLIFIPLANAQYRRATSR